jgi:IS5 family transposase
MNWQSVDERLIRQGELLLSLEFLERYDDELKTMNDGKEGRPFTLTHSQIVFLAVVRYLFGFPYRQLEGFTRALNRLLPKLPSADYSGLRRRILGVNLSPYEELEKSGKDVVIAVDSTGVRVHKAGGWVERKHGKKKRYVKIHLAVDVKTKQALAMIVTTDGTHDSRVFPELLSQAESRGKVSKVYADGAYDSSKVYRTLEQQKIEAIIKPRRNSRIDTPSKPRRRAITRYKRLGHVRWAKLTGYGKRWSVETAYSTFKRTFGEFCMAKTMKNITKELTTKAYIYNTLINL